MFIASNESAKLLLVETHSGATLGVHRYTENSTQMVACLDKRSRSLTYTNSIMYSKIGYISCLAGQIGIQALYVYCTENKCLLVYHDDGI